MPSLAVCRRSSQELGDQAGDAEVALQAVGPETMTHSWGLKVK